MKKIAIVKDFDDLGRVQVQILPEMEDIDDKSKLPWAYPEQRFDAKTEYSRSVPAIDSFILVDVDDTWTNFVYSGKRPYLDPSGKSDSAFQEAKKVNSSLSKLPEYIKYSDNFVIFKDFDGNVGIKSGDIFINADKSGNVEINNGNGYIKLNAAGDADINGHLTVSHA